MAPFSADASNTAVRATTPEPAKSRAREWLSGLSLACYGSIVLLATLWPTPLDKGYESSIARLLTVLHHNGIPEWFGYNKLEFSANIVIFIPLGFMIALLLPRRLWWLALLICPALSTCIELTQATFLAARFATVTDVISNSIGGVLGTIVAFLLRAIVYTRDEKVIAHALWGQNARR